VRSSAASFTTELSARDYYLDLKQNWQPIYEDRCDLFSGITLHLCPGHSPGLMVMQVNMPQDGPFIVTSDHWAVKEHHVDNVCQGFVRADCSAMI
jgi:hypothetical protein